MGFYALADGVSFCDAGGQYIFLDVARDRYFSLATPSETAFARFAAGEPLTCADREQLAALQRQGVLTVRDSSSVIPSPPRPVAPRCALVDMPPSSSAAQIAVAAFMLLRARRWLRRRSLASLLACVRCARTHFVAAAPDRREKQLVGIAGAFRRAALATGSLDQCLALSLALTHRCLSRGIDVSLVLGVRLRPFQAHAWVQAGPLLVSDALEVVTPFTPILVI